MLRFLVTRRWLGLIVAVIVVAVVCVQLGRWQFQRYDERAQRNETTRANLAAEPVPVAEVMSTAQQPDEDDQWRVVEATGRYDVEYQLSVLYRTRDGAPGVDVVVPLVTGSGAALIVDRGWVATTGSGSVDADIPPPPSGTVTVTGWVRSDATGDGIEPNDGDVRAISSRAIGDTLPYDVYAGFVDLQEEQPEVEPSPIPADEPNLSGGPSFFYGLQWWFFGLLALAFLGYFARREYQDTRAPGRTDDDVREPG